MRARWFTRSRWQLAGLVLLAAFASHATATAARAGDAASADKKKVVFIAGPRSHGYGSHEHRAGCMILAKALNENMPGVQAVVYTDGWPKDPEVLEGADCIVMYGDGGGGHMVNRNLATMDKYAKAGVGIVCIHYAVEVPKGESGDRFLDWIGGYFEAHWSVNPHWTADFAKLPDHPITRGVKPFAINDEWYYHMRFRPEMKNVAPILTAVPPDSTRERPDGPHSGNPTVRARKGEAEHVAWAAVREDGGRGFGFTGGHNHWNWGSDNFRKLMLNAIVWCAKAEVPDGGVPSKPLTVEDLKANQDFQPPDNFDYERIERLLKEWNG
jgi:type 1 glutamine amidotransferase